MRARPRLLSLAFTAILVLLAATSATAQSALATDWRQPFLGDWQLSLETPGGSQPVAVVIAETSDGVAVRVGFPDPPAEPISDVTRMDESLLARFTVPYEGMDIPIALRLTPDGEALMTAWEIADGEFQVTVRATKR